MMRQCRLCNIKLFKNFTSTQTTLPKHLKNLKAYVVPKRFQYLYIFLLIHIPTLIEVFHIDIFLCKIQFIEICQMIFRLFEWISKKRNLSWLRGWGFTLIPIKATIQKSDRNKFLSLFWCTNKSLNRIFDLGSYFFSYVTEFIYVTDRLYL